VADKPNKNTWGLVQMDETSKLYHKIKERPKPKQISPRLWRKDWKK